MSDRAHVRALEARLRRRLVRVQALYDGATTDGEREAAARARERLLVRLHEVRSGDTVALYCAAYVASLGVPGAPEPPPTPMPSRREVLGVLVRWEAGDLATAQVVAWACRVVDEVHMPEDSSHEDACRAELMLQLSAMHRILLLPTDVPRIRRFLAERDWEGWFELLTEAAARTRPRRRKRAG